MFSPLWSRQLHITGRQRSTESVCARFSLCLLIKITGLFEHAAQILHHVSNTTKSDVDQLGCSVAFTPLFVFVFIDIQLCEWQKTLAACNRNTQSRKGLWPDADNKAVLSWWNHLEISVDSLTLCFTLDIINSSPNPRLPGSFHVLPRSSS